MKYEVMFHVNVSIDDINKIVNYVDQGWTYGESNSYQSFAICLHKCVTIEADSDAHIEMYVHAFNSIGGIDQYISEVYNTETNEKVSIE